MLLLLSDHLFGLLNVINQLEKIWLNSTEEKTDPLQTYRELSWSHSTYLEGCGYISVFPIFNSTKEYYCRLSIPRIKDPRDFSSIYFLGIHYVYISIDVT